MRTDSHDGELTLPLPKVPGESAPREPAPGAPAPRERGAAVRQPAASGESSRRRRRSPGRKGPSKRFVLGLLATLVVVGIVSQVPAVKTVLRQSFTQLPAANTELYFTGSPSVNGSTLSVPITVDAHASSARSVAVKVWLVNGSGATDAATSVTLPLTHGIAAKVVTIQVPADAEIVYVNLIGQPQTLHYRIAGIRIPASAGPT